MVTRVSRGLSYPAIRQRPFVPLNKAQLVLLTGAGEEEFTRWVKSRAHCYGWNGIHTRDSEGVIESVHTLRMDGFCEGLGIPDWEFWHEGFKQSFKAELKGASGELHKYQKREIASMRLGGQTVVVWYPRDAPMVEQVFRYGLEALQQR